MSLSSPSMVFKPRTMNLVSSSSSMIRKPRTMKVMLVEKGLISLMSDEDAIGWTMNMKMMLVEKGLVLLINDEDAVDWKWGCFVRVENDVVSLG